jgi:uncharacterized BrkB/YihY/UPF0761 family membrane protein
MEQNSSPFDGLRRFLVLLTIGILTVFEFALLFVVLALAYQHFFRKPTNGIENHDFGGMIVSGCVLIITFILKRSIKKYIPS